MAKAPPSAEQARDQILELLKANPEGLRVAEIVAAILGDSTDLAEHRRRATRISYLLASLAKAKLVRKGKGIFGAYTLADHHPSPEISDLPVKRRYNKRNANGSAEGLRAYIIRDIRAKLAELESLD